MQEIFSGGGLETLIFIHIYKAEVSIVLSCDIVEDFPVKLEISQEAMGLTKLGAYMCMKKEWSLGHVSVS